MENYCSVLHRISSPVRYSLQEFAFAVLTVHLTTQCALPADVESSLMCCCAQFERNASLYLLKSVHNTDVSWTLGALLSLLSPRPCVFSVTTVLNVLYST